MKEICYATYSEDFIDTGTKIFKELGLDIDIHVWGTKDINYYNDAGIKVIIGRGRTAEKIRKTLQIPVVEIPINFTDIISALAKASKISDKVGIVGYNNLLKNLDVLNTISNVKVIQEFANDEEDIKRIILSMKNQGVKAIIGGIAQTKIAEENGIAGIRLDLTKEGLTQAYAEAVTIVQSIEKSEIKNKELNIILNNTTEGYISVDKENNITLANYKALKLKNISLNDYVVGHKLTQIFPEFNTVINKSVLYDEEIEDILTVNNKEILCRIIPLKNKDDESAGNIVKISDIKIIADAEQKIREKILDKGFVADYKFEDIIGCSESLNEIKKQAQKFAKTNSTVLILGKTGSGKELFAQSIHNFSLRKGEPFVAVNCGSLPQSLLESELFGYEKGAFTGANKEGKKGLFELSHKGTIFLDEISEMSLNLQARFLRVLQEKKVIRLGGSKVIPIDVRVIAATNRDLKKMVFEKSFREDLFYRLNVLPVAIPELNQRKEDVRLLAEIFWNKFSNKKFNITEKALEILDNYSWPGNVRQLENYMEKISIMSEQEILTSTLVKETILKYEPLYNEDHKNLKNIKLDEKEVKEVLEFYHYNKTKTAESLGIHRSTLWRFLEK